MRLLVDSHALLWLMSGSPLLTDKARTAITTIAEVNHVSAASAWEITTKHRLGKLPLADRISVDFERSVVAAGFTPLSVTMAHATLAGQLVGSNKDPFDRMLIAQALLERLTLVSNETSFDQFGVSRLW